MLLPLRQEPFTPGKLATLTMILTAPFIILFAGTKGELPYENERPSLPVRVANQNKSSNRFIRGTGHIIRSVPNDSSHLLHAFILAIQGKLYLNFKSEWIVLKRSQIMFLIYAKFQTSF